jgi:hypothetical protein
MGAKIQEAFELLAKAVGILSLALVRKAFRRSEIEEVQSLIARAQEALK